MKKDIIKIYTIKMDLRIVNTCNNNCLYCLEQSNRTKEEYLDKNRIFSFIDDKKDDEVISFYGWNPLLHPAFEEIVLYCKDNWFKHIWILTNTFSLNKSYLDKLSNAWLTTISFYFNSFDVTIHNKIVNWWINLVEFEKNIELLKESKLNYKAIIHVNKQNIKSLYKDILVLNKKYSVKIFEFVNYFPFDRPYDEYRKLLEYDYVDNKSYINLLFITIIKLELDAKFFKFSKIFFWQFINYYDFNAWILKQIWEEDIERLKEDEPFCYYEKRCNNCFIKDNCKFYV